MMISLDLPGCPLDGVNLIEASAGTGKTWTLCGLYLRLLVEGRRSVRDILVVTFTTAATAELKERIRSRLAEMQRTLINGSAHAGDPFVIAYAEALQQGRCRAVTANRVNSAFRFGLEEELEVRHEVGLDDGPVDGLEGEPGDDQKGVPRTRLEPFESGFEDESEVISITEARKRIDDALHQFDEAAIFTIHGFCQRALSEVPFAAGMPFAFETLQSDAAQVHQVATDFYRTHIAAGHRDRHLAARLHERFPPERVTRLLRHRLGKPLDRIEFDLPASGDRFARYCQTHEAARALWWRERSAIMKVLRDGLPGLKGTVYKTSTIAGGATAMDEFLRDPFAPSIAKYDKTRYLSARHLALHVKAAGTVPEHPFFDLIEELEQLEPDAEEELAGIELGLIETLLNEAPERLRALKRQRRVIAFDDMLFNLHDALRKPELAWLASALRQRYPVALIDEFQDTDPLQFEIFSAIWQPQGSRSGPEAIEESATPESDPAANDPFEFDPLKIDPSEFEPSEFDPFESDPSLLEFSLFAPSLPDPSRFGLLASDFPQANPAHSLPAAAGRLAAGPLFLIGDPKQAIYGFRGADLFTYLAAAEQAARRYTLGTNQRSVAPLIAAMNALFSRNPRPFVLDRLDYHPVAASERAKPVFQDDDCAAALQLWLLPDELESKGRAERLATHATAAEISRLLRGSQAGTVRIGERPLVAGDIAVIVRSHHQGRNMRRALLRLGIASVERSQDSVFDTEQAQDLELFLRALAEPGRERALNAALASELFGLRAADLAAEAADESLLAQRLAQFAHYRALWLRRGFAAMWRTVQADTRLVQRLLPLPGGERSVTNYIHLGELLHAASAEHEGIDAMVRWYRAMRDDERAPEQAQLRLESDERLVQIATVHAAKGLEYPITFCPFLWADGTGSKLEPMRASFHDTRLRAVTRYALDNSDGAAKQREEEFAESVRNLYVALTRGVYRTVLIAGLYAYKKDKGKASARSSLNWLAAGRGRSGRLWLDDQEGAALDAVKSDIATAWRELAEACPGAVEWTPLPDAPGERLTASGDEENRLQARHATRKLESSWSLASFTSLSQATTNRPASRELPERDHDELVPDGHGEAAPDQDQESGDAADATDRLPAGQIDLFASPSPDNMLLFPRGAEPGTLLHAVFEHADFTDTATWDGAISRALLRHPLTLAPLDAAASAPRLHAMLRSALAQVVQADLNGQGLRLADVGMPARLNELGFSFSARQTSMPALTRTLAAAGVALPGMDRSEVLTGYIRGAIDCVFRHQGRYYLADWKSNWLGSGRTDYLGGSLERAVTDAGYTLQYALYTLALHRYLRQRLRDYDYERDFGGAFYIFVRGVQPGWQQTNGASAGIHFARLDGVTVDQLDALFAGNTITKLASSGLENLPIPAPNPGATRSSA